MLSSPAPVIVGRLLIVNGPAGTLLLGDAHVVDQDVGRARHRGEAGHRHQRIGDEARLQREVGAVLHAAEAQRAAPPAGSRHRVADQQRGLLRDVVPAPVHVEQRRRSEGCRTAERELIEKADGADAVGDRRWLAVSPRRGCRRSGRRRRRSGPTCRTERVVHVAAPVRQLWRRRRSELVGDVVQRHRARIGHRLRCCRLVSKFPLRPEIAATGTSRRPSRSIAIEES